MPWPLEKSEFLMSVLTWINLPKYLTLTVYLTAFMIFSIKKYSEIILQHSHMILLKCSPKYQKVEQ